MPFFLICDTHGKHEITEAEMLEELQEPDRGFRCHAVPGCPDHTHSWEPEDDEA